jgi:hypothetical protein
VRGISIVGDISIRSGNITATGNFGAGIGSAEAVYNGTSLAGDIIVHDGNITAAGFFAAGIGSGHGDSGTASVGNIVIHNGNITARSSALGAGIGSGYAVSALSSGGNICVFSGNVTATGQYGAGIGSGVGNYAASSVRDIFIRNGNITVRGSESAGIGRGCSNSSVDAIHISGGFVSVLDGSFGVGIESGTGSLTIGSAHIDCRAIRTKMCLQAPSVIFDNGSFTGVTGASNFINSSTVSFSGSPSIFVIYGGSSAQEKFTGLPIIHIPLVPFSCKSSYDIRVTGKDFERRVPFNAKTDTGFGISGPSLGNYGFTYNSSDCSSKRRLTHDGSCIFSASTKSDTVYTNVVSDEMTNCPLYPTDLFTEGVSFSFHIGIFRSGVYLAWLL